MNAPICPNCGGALEILSAASNPNLVCHQCGWNCESSRQGLRGELLNASVWLVVFLALAAGKFIFKQSVVAFLVIPVIAWVWGFKRFGKRLQKLNRVLETPEGALRPSASASFLSLLSSRDQAQDIFGALLNVPKPRPLRWNWRIRLAVAFLTIVAIAAILILSAPTGPEDLKPELTFLFILAGVAAVVIFPFLHEISKRRLLSEGELVIGRVVYQQTVQQGRNNRSKIFYAFADSAGRGYIGRGTDYSDSLASGAPILVYYDALNPNKNTAMESSRLSVKA